MPGTVCGTHLQAVRRSGGADAGCVTPLPKWPKYPSLEVQQFSGPPRLRPEVAVAKGLCWVDRSPGRIGRTDLSLSLPLDRQAGRQAVSQSGRHAGMQAVRQSGRQAVRERERERSRQPSRLSEATSRDSSKR